MVSREQGGTPLRCVGPLLRETRHVLNRFTLTRILLDYSLGKRDQSKIDRPGKIGPREVCGLGWLGTIGRGGPENRPNAPPEQSKQRGRRVRAKPLVKSTPQIVSF